MQTGARLADENWALGSGPFVLSGRPPHLEGIVELTNRSARRLEVGAIALHGLNLKSHPGPVPEAVAAFARLDPNERASVRMRLTLDPTLPAGRYGAHLSCGAQHEEIVIEVLENITLSVNPAGVSISAAPGQKIKFQVFVSNRGNVATTPQAPDSIYLNEDRDVLEVASQVAKESGKDGFQKFLDRFLREWADGVAGPAAVHVKPRRTTLHPGETKEVEVEVDLPDDMRRKRVYKGKIRFRNAAFALEVDCN
jgi:hypothetical protein